MLGRSALIPLFIITLYVSGVENVVICGIEGHVCVKSTVYELLKRGISTHVVVDAVSSRSMTDRYGNLLALTGTNLLAPVSGTYWLVAVL